MAHFKAGPLNRPLTLLSKYLTCLSRRHVLVTLLSVSCFLIGTEKPLNVIKQEAEPELRTRVLPK